VTVWGKSESATSESAVTRPQRQEKLSAGERWIQISLDFANIFANMAISINDMKRAQRFSLVDSRIYGYIPFVNSLEHRFTETLDSASGAAIHSSHLEDEQPRDILDEDGGKSDPLGIDSSHSFAFISTFAWRGKKR
jgi:hypothetical protein